MPRMGAGVVVGGVLVVLSALLTSLATVRAFWVHTLGVVSLYVQRELAQ